MDVYESTANLNGLVFVVNLLEEGNTWMSDYPILRFPGFLMKQSTLLISQLIPVSVTHSSLANFHR